MSFNSRYGSCISDKGNHISFPVVHMWAHARVAEGLKDIWSITELDIFSRTNGRLDHHPGLTLYRWSEMYALGCLSWSPFIYIETEYCFRSC